MPVRKIVAVVVAVVWVGAMGWHAKRLYLRPEAEQLAAAARTLPPGVAYYSVWLGERHAGWAQTEIDTLPSASGFVIRDRLQLDLGSLGLGGEAAVRSRAELGRRLDLRWFALEAQGVLGDMVAEGRLVGDSIFRVTITRGGEETRRRIPVEGPVVLGTALPLRLAVEADLQPGDRLRIPTFDPVEMQSVARAVEVLERRVRTYPDSATRGPETGEWVVARRDTVTAWRVSREMAGAEMEAWVDEDGRYLELEGPAGLHLERTAFELAYYGWRESRR